MYLVTLTVLALLSIANAELMPRIVKGNDVKEGEIPYQVFIQFWDLGVRFFQCSGSILNENYVITTASCVAGIVTKDNIMVIAGTVNNTVTEEQRKLIHSVEKIIIHEKYDDDLVLCTTNNIALLKVKEPFVPSPQIGFVTLPSPEDVVNINDWATISGWGGWGKNSILQRTNVLINDLQYCSKEFYNCTFDDSICAYDPTTKSGCIGDCGSPLTVKGKLVGILFYQHNCERPYMPDVYTRISAYLDWIKVHAV